KRFVRPQRSFAKHLLQAGSLRPAEFSLCGVFKREQSVCKLQFVQKENTTGGSRFMRNHFEGQRPSGAEPVPKAVQCDGKYTMRERGLCASNQVKVTFQSPHQTQLCKGRLNIVLDRSLSAGWMSFVHANEALHIALNRGAGDALPVPALGELHQPIDKLV